MAQAQDQRCNGCGLMVQPGYARCPRCKMPQKKGGPGAGGKPQGGTAVDAAANRVTFIALGLMALVVVAVVLLARGGGGDDSPAEGDSLLPTPTARPTTQPTTQPTTTIEDNREVGFTGSEADAGSRSVQLDVIKQVEEGLAGRRLWAKVSADRATGTIMSVRSANCADPRMKTVLEKTGEKLKEAGFVSVRCVEKAGGLVFALDL